jgi:hypothetical protein
LEPVAMMTCLATTSSSPTLTFPASPSLPTKAAGHWHRDLVLLEQALDAPGQLIDDAILADHLDADVDLRRADLDALGFKAVTRFFEHVRGMQQCLGRNAAHIQAGTAETRLTLGIGVRIGLAQAVLKPSCGADGRHITTGATADDEYVEFFGHETPF